MENAKALWKKYQAGLCTEEERTLLENWFHHFGRDNQIDLSEEDLLNLKREMWKEIDEIAPERKQYRLWPRIAAAASVIAVLSFGGYILLRKQQPEQIVQVKKHGITPGRNQATLTLANGQKIILTKGLTGTLAQQGRTLVNVSGGNAIAYTNLANTGNANEPVQYNTLTTVRGEQSPYPLVLADGTKVWLNAASSITFPTAFTGRERIVKITGEAYFEVAHNPRQPFAVSANGEIVQDIGTAFNINAYTDEPAVITSLVEGSVRIVKAQNSEKLSPGQQSVIAASQDNIKVRHADLEEALAWKNGLFVFNDESLESIMRKVSRWYDVDITYKEVDKNELFWGSMSRYDNISKVLRNLELTGDVHFIIEGRRLIATK